MSDMRLGVQGAGSSWGLARVLGAPLLRSLGFVAATRPHPSTSAHDIEIERRTVEHKDSVW